LLKPSEVYDHLMTLAISYLKNKLFLDHIRLDHCCQKWLLSSMYLLVFPSRNVIHTSVHHGPPI